MTVRLKTRVSTRKPIGRNGNGTNNGTNEVKVTTAKKTATARKKTPIIEEPVVIKVTRTVKTKFLEAERMIEHSTDQEVPDQPKDEDTEIDLDVIEVRRFLVEPAKVNYHYTLGRNVLFQSVSVGCSVTIPCYKEEIEEALAEAKSLVAGRLKIENRKTGAVLDHLVKQRIEADQGLSNRGIR